IRSGTCSVSVPRRTRSSGTDWHGRRADCHSFGGYDEQANRGCSGCGRDGGVDCDARRCGVECGRGGARFHRDRQPGGQGFHLFAEAGAREGSGGGLFLSAAYTGGCDLEAHTFATEKDKFTQAGATIIGVSADSIARLNQFSSDPKYCAGKFAVASDPGGKIATQYDLKMMPPQKGVTDVEGKPVMH